MIKILCLLCRVTKSGNKTKLHIMLANTLDFTETVLSFKVSIPPPNSNSTLKSTYVNLH